MPSLPLREQQIIQAHAPLIVAVVKAVHNPATRSALEDILRVSTANGWADLVRTIRRILSGERDTELLQGLDEEDSAIVTAILRGLQNPATLPDPNQSADPTLAAPGLASMIYAARQGSVEALQLLARMAEQMTQIGGDMGKLGGIMRQLSQGERNADNLCRGMGAQGRSLVLSILEEIGKLEHH